MKHATNSAVMRESNRKLILNILRIAPTSRADLAERTHLTRASVTQIVDELIADGLVKELEVIESKALGRKRTSLALCKNARFAIGVSIHRKRIYVGICELCGDTLAQVDFDSDGMEPTAAIDEICANIKKLCRKLRLDKSKILGVGVSAPGPVDYLRGAILNPPNFTKWHGLPVCHMIAERTGYTVLLEKDSNSRALEERFFGAAQSFADFMLVQIGGGVGSGVMSRDKLYRGKYGRSTEIGHMTVDLDGPECICGNFGCLEICLAMQNLMSGTRFTSWSELMDEAETPDAAEVLDKAARYLSAAFIGAFNMYDIDRILLVGSDFAGAAEPLISRINSTVSKRILTREFIDGDPVIEGSTIGSARTGAMAMLYGMFSDRE